MWKIYDRFYDQILKSETNLILRSQNVHKNFIMKTISLTFIVEGSITSKKALLHLGGSQLVMDRKGKIVLSNKAKFTSKIRKGIGLGSNILIRKKSCQQFMFFCFFNLLSQSNIIKLINYDVSNRNICFHLNVNKALIRLLPNSRFFQELNDVRLVFSFTDFYNQNFFLLRFFKFPIKSF